MNVSRKLRGAAAGVMLAALSLGAVSLATPSQAAEVSFGIFVNDRRPPPRFERVPPPPRYYERADWHRGQWAWQGHRWHWVKGYYAHPHRDGRWADRDWDRDHRDHRYR